MTERDQVLTQPWMGIDAETITPTQSEQIGFFNETALLDPATLQLAIWGLIIEGTHLAEPRIVDVTDQVEIRRAQDNILALLAASSDGNQITYDDASQQSLNEYADQLQEQAKARHQFLDDRQLKLAKLGVYALRLHNYNNEIAQTAA